MNIDPDHTDLDRKESNPLHVHDSKRIMNVIHYLSRRLLPVASQRCRIVIDFAIQLGVLFRLPKGGDQGLKSKTRVHFTNRFSLTIYIGRQFCFDQLQIQILWSL